MFGEAYEDVMERSRRLGIPHVPLEDAYVLQGIAFASSTREGLVLDLGAGIGFSTIWVAEGAKKFGRKVIAVEKDERLFRELSEVADKWGFEAVNADAVEFLSRLEDGSVAFAFVDVDKHLYVKIAELLSRKLVPGGVAAFHNAFVPAPPKEFFDVLKNNFIYTIVPTSLGIAVAARESG